MGKMLNFYVSFNRLGHSFFFFQQIVWFHSLLPLTQDSQLLIPGARPLGSASPFEDRPLTAGQERRHTERWRRARGRNKHISRGEPWQDECLSFPQSAARLSEVDRIRSSFLLNRHILASVCGCGRDSNISAVAV